MLLEGNVYAAEAYAQDAADSVKQAKSERKAELKKKWAERKSMGLGSTSLSLFYDFGADRQLFTTTIEGFYADPWGSTFFFIDHDFPLAFSPAYKDLTGSERALGGTYWEISRALNFWQNSAAKDLSVHVEYNGGAYRTYSIPHSFLVGLEYFLHTRDFKNTFTLQLMYRHILYAEGDWGKGITEKHHQSLVPLQFTFVWGMKDLGGVKGLSFSGYMDFWGQEHWVYPVNMGTGLTDWTSPKLSHFVFQSEPQLWYAVGQHFGCENLNLGTELELSYDFGSGQGFKCRPCLGLKWIF